MHEFVGKHHQAHKADSTHLTRTRKVTPAQDEAPFLPVGTAPRFSHDFSRIPVHAASAGVIQTKLTINRPGDIYEQEADRFAEQVMRMPEPQTQRPGVTGQGEHAGPSQVQAKSIQGSEAGGMDVPPIVHEALNSSGRPLDAATRGFMEPRFGHDFSRVRVHTDGRASEAASAIAARAFTVNNDVVFGGGQYTPQTEAGRWLLSHELTHVVQQGGGMKLTGRSTQSNSAYETQANRVEGVTVHEGRAESFVGEEPGVVRRYRAASAAMLVTHNVDQSLQMQQAGKQTPQNQKMESPNVEFLRASFQKMLNEQRLNEEINGAMARALARAYVNRPLEIHAVPYIYERVIPGPLVKPTENEVYRAILGGLDMKMKWKPAPGPTDKTRDDALVETGRYVVADFLGGKDAKEIAVQQTKDLVVSYSAKWLARKGLIAIAEILTGAYAIIGFFEAICSTLELLNTLRKPEKRGVSKNELIVEDVRGWLQHEQGLVEEARKKAATQAEFRASLLKPYRPEIFTMVRDNTNVVH